jgi:hypothetical protein
MQLDFATLHTASVGSQGKAMALLLLVPLLLLLELLPPPPPTVSPPQPAVVESAAMPPRAKTRTTFDKRIAILLRP